jgi:hypothetical protein
MRSAFLYREGEIGMGEVRNKYKFYHKIRDFRRF